RSRARQSPDQHDPRRDLAARAAHPAAPARRLARPQRSRDLAHPTRLLGARHQLALQHGVPLLPQRGEHAGTLRMDYVLIDGDMAIFQPTFGAATVVVQPGTLKASGPGTVGSKGMCVEGDEGSVSVPGCMYMTSQHTIPGVGTLEIAALAGDQKATK